MSWLLLTSCLVVQLLCPTHGQSSYQSSGWWMDQPYDSDRYNERVEYLDNITLTCEDTLTADLNLTILYWVLPDLRVMYANEINEYFTLDGDATWQVSNDSRLLYVTLVQEPQFGFYHCHLQDEVTEEHFVVKTAINYKGPYFGNLWDKYELNVIIACSAAGGLLLIIICIYVVYIFRYQEEEEPADVGDEAEDNDDGYTELNKEEAAGYATTSDTADEDRTGPSYNDIEGEPTYAEVNKVGQTEKSGAGYENPALQEDDGMSQPAEGNPYSGTPKTDRKEDTHSTKEKEEDEEGEVEMSSL